MEDGFLFGLPTPRGKHGASSVSKDTVAEPASKPIAATRPSHEIPVSTPRHITYNEFLGFFNGDSALALYWFDKQSKKD